MAEATGIDFAILKEWENGLKELDIEKINRALAAGLSPSTYVRGKHPLHEILGVALTNVIAQDQLREIFKQVSAVKAITSDTFQKKSDIIDALVSHGLSLTEPLKNAGQSLIDSILFGGDATLAAKLVYEAIKQTIAAGQPAYEFTLDRVIAAAKLEGDEGPLDVSAKRSNFLNILDRLDEVHDHVRAVLENPANDKDRAFFKKHAGKVTFWQNDFEYPDDDTLDAMFPVDAEEYKKAEEELEDMWGSERSSKSGMGAGQKRKDDEDSKADETKIVILEKEDPDAILAEIGTYTGWEDFKDNMEAMVDRVEYDKVLQARGMPTDVQNYHTAFLGPPGTGKTTKAFIKVRLLHALDMVGPRYAQLSRADVTSHFFGATDGKVQDILDKVDTLFIDEAYALVGGSSGGHQDYGQQAINTIVAAMGNRKDNFTLFVAGYKGPMLEFIASNEGLSSRIKVIEESPSFTGEELKTILESNLATQKHILAEGALEAFSKGIEDERESRKEYFGNARVIVTITQAIPDQIASRLRKEYGRENFAKVSDEELKTITVADVEAALKVMRASEDKKAVPFGFVASQDENKVQDQKPEQNTRLRPVAAKVRQGM